MTLNGSGDRIRTYDLDGLIPLRSILFEISLRLLSFLRKHSVSNAVRKVTNKIKKHTMFGVHNLAPEIGFEPTTLRLTAACSTAELLRNINGYFAILSNWKFNVNNFTQFFYNFLDLI